MNNFNFHQSFKNNFNFELFETNPNFREYLLKIVDQKWISVGKKSDNLVYFENIPLKLGLSIQIY